MPEETAPFITPDALLAHWQGHRRLTRRVIDAFPEDKLFTFSLGGMRTFGELSTLLRRSRVSTPSSPGTSATTKLRRSRS